MENSATIGALASRRWVDSLGIIVPPRAWGVEVMLDVTDQPAPRAFDFARATRFHVSVWHAEWDFFFCHLGRASWIRVTDVPFVHGKDDFGLLAEAPSLEKIGSLLGTLEREHGVQFRRHLATIRADVDARSVVRAWVLSL